MDIRHAFVEAMNKNALADRTVRRSTTPGLSSNCDVRGHGCPSICDLNISNAFILIHKFGAQTQILQACPEIFLEGSFWWLQ